MIRKEYIAKKPEDVGVEAERLEALFERAKRDVDEGSLSSVQVAVARRGKVAGVATFGTAHIAGREQPATNETLYPLFSCTKGIIGVAMWALLEDGMLRLDEKVADIIPEFGTNGKEVVTVEQLLLHTSGFPHANVQPELWGDRAKLLEAFGEWRLNWEPGSRFEYHLMSAHFVLAEIIHRRTGRDHRTFIRQRLAEPMGLDELFVGAPPDVDSRVAEFKMTASAEPNARADDRVCK